MPPAALAAERATVFVARRACTNSATAALNLSNMQNNIDPNNIGGGKMPKPRPLTTEAKLDDALKRLGRIEKHLIDIRDALHTEPGQPRYVIERNNF
jgi:hypothetical protein